MFWRILASICVGLLSVAPIVAYSTISGDSNESKKEGENNEG